MTIQCRPPIGDQLVGGLSSPRANAAAGQAYLSLSPEMVLGDKLVAVTKPVSCMSIPLSFCRSVMDNSLPPLAVLRSVISCFSVFRCRSDLMPGKTFAGKRSHVYAQKRQVDIWPTSSNGRGMFFDHFQILFSHFDRILLCR